MSTFLFIRQIIPIALVTIVATSVARAADPASKPATEPSTPRSVATVYAERYYEADDMPSPDILEAMIRRAASQHANILSASPSKVAAAMGVNVKGKQLTIEIDVTSLPDAKPRADELLDQVATSLEQDLNEFHASKLRLSQANAQFQDAKREYDHSRDGLAELREKIRQVADRSDLSMDRFENLTSSLEQERQTLKLKLVGSEARQTALAANIDKLSKAATERAKDDPVAAELQKVVEARESALSRVAELKESGTATPTEVDNAKAAVAEVRAKMLERRDTIMTGGGGNLLTTMNQELASISADVADGMARLAYIEQTLVKMRGVSELLEQEQDFRKELRGADNRRSQAEQILRTRREALASSSLRFVTGRSIRDDDPGLQDPGLQRGSFGNSPPGH